MKTTTATPVIEVKKVAFGAEATHQETLNFQCEVWIDGKMTAYASNNGHGGQTNIQCAGGPDAVDQIRAAEAYCKTLPDHQFEPLESFVDDLVNDIYNKKGLDKLHKKIEKLCINHLVIGNAKRLAEGTIEGYAAVKYGEPIASMLANPKKLEWFTGSVKKHISQLAKGESIFNKNLGVLQSLVK